MHRILIEPYNFYVCVMKNISKKCPIDISSSSSPSSEKYPICIYSPSYSTLNAFSIKWGLKCNNFVTAAIRNIAHISIFSSV